MEDQLPVENVVSLCERRQEQVAQEEKIEVEVLLCTQCGSKHFMLSLQENQIFCSSCLVPSLTTWKTDHVIK